MSYFWSKLSLDNPSRYSTKYRYQNGVKRNNLTNASCDSSNASHETIKSSRFRFRRETGSIPRAPGNLRKIIRKNFEKNQVSEIKTVNNRFNMFKTASKSAYGFSSIFSKFKYNNNKYNARPLMIRRSKSIGRRSANPFVYQKPTPKNIVTCIHPYRLCVKRAINLNRRFVRRICPDYVKTGLCENGDFCQLRHDPKYLRICSKFLQNACLLGENKCTLAHIMDPCRIPQCAYFAKGACSRCCCNFLHIKYPKGTPFCPDFLVGRCENWSTCKKRHIWRGESDSSKTEMSTSTSAADAYEDLAKKSAQLGSLRETKVVPDYIPFYISDD